MDYKLSSVIYAHTSDVRSLDVFPDGTIVSGSRDATAKLWKHDGGTYKNTLTYHGHSNFVFAVCVLPQTSSHPWGLVVTGSSDKTIRGYVPDEEKAVFIFTDHSDTVCDISPAVTAGFLSASWDKTAKLWDTTLKECQVTYTGHTMAVWCVLQLPGGNVLTGSADHSIRIHSHGGDHIRVLTGHKDCVRSFSHVKDSEFLSCSNDGSIRHWNASTGSCLNEYDCHPNYIYSISTSRDGLIASSGEDNYVHIRSGNHSKHLILPAQSVWAVKFLPNSDLATACSDGSIRIFTTEPSRQADERVMNAFQEEVKRVLLNRDIGGIKTSELPGPEVLLQSGTRDGQIKMIREPTGVMCYKWSSIRATWDKIGDVMGGIGGTQKTSGKKLYNGKEYDYVFDVEIEDGKPPLKLPYNLKENPSQSAHDFLIRNNLSVAHYLEQVTNFILQHCPQSNPVIPQFSDPYTGSARYVPTETGSPNNTGSATGTNNSISSDFSEASSRNAYFPQKQFLRFDIGDSKVILKKLLEFNSQQGEGGMPGSTIGNLEKMMLPIIDHSCDYFKDIGTLHKLLLWRKDFLFPVIDIIRLAVRDEILNSLICINDNGKFVINLALELLDEESLLANQITSLRLLTNMLLHTSGKELVLSYKSMIMERVIKLSRKITKKHVQIGISTLSLNFAVALQSSDGGDNDYSSFLTCFSEITCNSTDPEALFRSLVAVGTLVSHKRKPLELPPNLVQLLIMITEKNEEPSKITGCSEALLKLLVSDVKN